jgi:spore coat polysaccharide biosynthesis protein SpsF
MIVGILQARMSSTRLPGKVLKDVHGAPMILRQLERLARSTRLECVVVATSTDASDDSLVDILRANNVEVRRGSLDDVAGRFNDVVEEFQPETFVRLTADCPLADSTVIDMLIERHQESGADYSSNGLTRTFPVGLDAEVVNAAAFQRMLELELTPAEREHVTMGLYNRPELFTINEVVEDTDLSGLRWTVDEPEDLAFVQRVYDALYDGKPTFTTADILTFLAQNPERSRTAEHYRRELEMKQK